MFPDLIHWRQLLAASRSAQWAAASQLVMRSRRARDRSLRIRYDLPVRDMGEHEKKETRTRRRDRRAKPATSGRGFGA